MYSYICLKGLLAYYTLKKFFLLFNALWIFKPLTALFQFYVHAASQVTLKIRPPNMFNKKFSPRKSKT